MGPPERKKEKFEFSFFGFNVLLTCFENLKTLVLAELFFFTGGYCIVYQGVLYSNTLVTTYLPTPVCHAPKILYAVYSGYKLNLKGLIHIFLLINFIKSFRNT